MRTFSWEETEFTSELYNFTKNIVFLERNIGNIATTSCAIMSNVVFYKQYIGGTYIMATKKSLFVQYNGKQVEEKEIVASVKKAWTEAGNKVGDIKTMEVYVKPEEDAVYYVINETESGKVEF